MTTIPSNPLLMVTPPQLSSINESKEVATETQEFPENLSKSQMLDVALQLSALMTLTYGGLRVIWDINSIASIFANRIAGLCPNPCLGNTFAHCIDRASAICSIDQMPQSQTTTLAILVAGLALKYLPPMFIKNPVTLPQQNLPNPSNQRVLPLTEQMKRTFKAILLPVGIYAGCITVQFLWRTAWGTCLQGTGADENGMCAATADDMCVETNTCYTLFQNVISRSIMIPTMATGMILGTTLFNRVKALF